MEKPIAERTFDVRADSEVFEIHLAIFRPEITSTRDYLCRYVVTRDSVEIVVNELGGSDSVQALLMAARGAAIDIRGIAVRNRWSIPEWMFDDFRCTIPA